MPCVAGGIGTLVPGLFKAKAGNLLLNWGWTSEQCPKHGNRLVFRLVWLPFYDHGLDNALLFIPNLVVNSLP